MVQMDENDIPSDEDDGEGAASDAMVYTVGAGFAAETSEGE